jgi:predicted nucleotidyltransferase
VLTASGLESFDREFGDAREYEIDGIRVRVLPLERVIVSKRAAKRPKDSAQIPILEATLAARRARTDVTKDS